MIKIKKLSKSNVPTLLVTFQGLIDSHTHPIWQGDRINEFKMKVIFFYIILLLKIKNSSLVKSDLFD